jgi:ureidoglycolate lyase
MRDPTAPSRLRSFAAHDAPLVRATPESLGGYGLLAADFSTPVEIVTWPPQGWRPVDPDTGNQGGTVEGIFEFWWAGQVFYGRNDAVGDSYLIGWSCDPEQASEAAAAPDRSELLIWHANYHPDGGQLFFPREGRPFVAPLALPGDDVTPDKFVAFYFDGSCGLYIHPGVWHEAVFPLAERASFHDRQGAVHARISCDFVKEFNAYLRVPMRAP